jgi:chromosome segregation ATPase
MLMSQVSSGTDPLAQLKAENAQLKQSHEKLQKEFQTLRVQNAEALTSLKILEDENEELSQELDRLRNQLKNATPQNAP